MTKTNIVQVYNTENPLIDIAIKSRVNNFILLESDFVPA